MDTQIIEKTQILKAIINPICLHCSALTFGCKGLTIKDWKKAKECDQCDISGGSCNTLDILNIKDYLLGEDIY